MWGINGWVRRRNQYSVTANDKFHSALIRIRPVYICLPAPSSLSASASGRLLLNLNIINYGTILTEVIRPYWSCDYIQWELRESWPDAFRPEAFYCRQLFLSCFISGLSLLQNQSFVCFFFLFDFDSIQCDVWWVQSTLVQSLSQSRQLDDLCRESWKNLGQLTMNWSAISGHCIACSNES